MNDARTQAIREYLQAGFDRAETTQPNPLFAGRDDMLEPIMRSVKRLADSNHPLANLTTVLYGAPGSGKSEMLAQIRAGIDEMDTGSAIAVVGGKANLLTDARAFGTAVRKSLAMKRRSVDGQRSWGVSARIAVEGLGEVAGSAEQGGEDPDNRPELSKLDDIAEVIAEEAGGSPTIVLLIDEAQDKLRAARTKPDSFVSAFHLGEADLKVLPVYAGLGNTLAELGKCGVSRVAKGTRHLIHRLNDRDVAAMTEEALHALTGQDRPTIHRWTTMIVKRSQGWPMHVNHLLGGVAQRAAPRWTLDEGGFDAAMREARTLRAQYYEDRLKACPGLEPTMYSTWATLFSSDRPVHNGAVAAAFGLQHGEAKALMTEALAAGLVEQPQSGIYASTVPSLLDHIARRGEDLDGAERDGRR